MLKFLKYTFLTLFFLILIIAAGGFYFYKNFDPNNYKDKIQELASKALNRRLTINGDIKVALSLIPTIEINDIEISNPEWAVSPYFLKVKQADVIFKIKPLFDKKIEIDAINILGPQINLEISEKGEENWVFTSPDQTENQQTEDIKKEIENEIKNNPLAFSLGSIVLGDTLIKDGEITYFDAQKKQKETLKIYKIFSDYIDKNSNLNITADIQYTSYHLNGIVETASLAKFLNNQTDIPLKTNLKINKSSLMFDGIISEISEKANISGHIEVYNPKGGFDLPETKLVTDIKANFSEVELKKVALDIAKNLINGSIKINISGKIPNITASIKSKSINLETLIPQTSTTSYFPEIIKTANAATTKPNILNEKIDYSPLKILNGNFDIDIAKLIINKDLIVDGLKSKIKISNGTLTINPLNLVFAEGQIFADAIINANNMNIIANINTKDLIMQEVLDNLKYTNDANFGITAGGKTDVKANIKTSGQTYGDLLKNMNGNIIVILDKSKVQTGKLEFLSSNIISQILQSLKMYQPKDGKATVNCAVIRADIKNGIASFPNGIAVDTKNLTLVSSGSINLDNQKIDLSLKPSSKTLSGTNISQAISSLIKIKGTLDDPRIGVDDAGAIKTLVGVVTTGPVMLGSQVLLNGDDYPCYTALIGTEEAKRFPAPKGLTANTKKAYSATSDSIDNTVNGVISTANDLAGGLLNALSGKKKSSKKNAKQ